MDSSIPENHTQHTLDFEALSVQPVDSPIPQVQPYSPPQKKCTLCSVIKPLTDFDRNKSGKHGRQSACKICYRQRQKQLNARPKAIPPPKQCDTCHEVKPLSDFGRNRQNYDKKQTRCKACFDKNTWNKKEIPAPGQTKQCTGCHEVKPLSEFTIANGSTRGRYGVRSRCKVCLKAQREEYYATHPRKTYLRIHNAKLGRESKLRKKFNLTTAEYDEMFAKQNGVCALCGKPETARTRNKEAVRPLAIDHCHLTGRVRRLLCQNCNMMLGFSKDDPELLRRAADYIERYK